MPPLPIVSSLLLYLYLVEASLSTNYPVRKALRRIPLLRSISGQEMERIQGRLIHRSYRPGEVLWRTRRAVALLGFIEYGEIDIEYWIEGVLVRSTRLSAGDPVLPRRVRHKNQHTAFLARAVTDVRLCLVPEAQFEQRCSLQSTGAVHSKARFATRSWLKQIWPWLLLLLVVVLARSDIVRIVSGYLYLAYKGEQHSALYDPGSMELLKYAEQIDSGASFTYNEEGYRLFQQQKLPDAEAAFLQAVDRDPASAPALNNVAITYLTLGNLSHSVRYLQQAVAQDPDNALIRYNLGILLMRQNEDASAIREFRQAGFIDPQAAAPHLQQAFLYVQLGDYGSAEQSAREAIQLDPSQASAHLLLALALYHQGKDTEALVSITDSLSLDPGNRVAIFYQAHILGRIGQYDVALPILERLLMTATDLLEADRITVEIEAVHRALSELETVAH